MSNPRAKLEFKMGDFPIKVSWRSPKFSEKGGGGCDSVETTLMMPPTAKLLTLGDPGKIDQCVWINHCKTYFNDPEIPESGWPNIVRGLLGEETTTMMPPIAKLLPFDDPSKMYPWVWIAHCEMYFNYRGIPEFEWLNNVRGLLGGEMKVWFDKFFRMKKGKVAWREFRSEIREVFGNDDPVDVCQRFRYCRQRDQESVLDFACRFTRICDLYESHIRGSRERFRLYMFVSALNDDIICLARLLEPTSLNDAVWKASMAYKYYEAMKKMDAGC